MVKATGRPSDRLLVESYELFEPRLALRTARVRFWMKFNTEPDRDGLMRYLSDSESRGRPWEEILLALFAQGIESIGHLGIDEWRQVLARAKKEGRLVGVDERAYPYDPGSMFRFHAELRRVPARHADPGLLSIGHVERFLPATAPATVCGWRRWRPGDYPVAYSRSIHRNSEGHTRRCAWRPTSAPTCCSATPGSPW